LPLADGLARVIADPAYDSGKGDAAAENLSGRFEIPFPDRCIHGAHVDMDWTGGCAPRGPFLDAVAFEPSQFLLIHNLVQI
jgi:hypothetical protein